MKKKDKTLVSVIIPAYKQAKTIKNDLRSIESVLQKIRYDYEIIVVVDGKEDQTYKRAKSLVSSRLKVYLLRKNHGKGFAIKHGFTKTKGSYIAFIDAGMEIDPNGLSMLLEHLEWYNADIIVGSKRHPVSQVHYPLERKILSLVYYWIVRLLFNLKIKDTQAGIKISKRKVLEKVLPLMVVKQYAFDIELLSVAKRLGFSRIFEAPIKLDFRPDSLTSSATLKTIWHMLYDTAAVFYRLNILSHYTKKRRPL